MGLARGALHLTGGCREKDFPAVAGTCLPLRRRAEASLTVFLNSLGTSGGIVMHARLAGCLTSC